MLVDDKLLDDLSAQAKSSPRLRMNRRTSDRRDQAGLDYPKRGGGKAKLNFNFHQSLEDKCHNYGSRQLRVNGLLNKLAGHDRRSGSMIHDEWFNYGKWLMIPIHGHPDKDESFVILRGKVRSTTYNDDGSVIGSVVLSQEDGIYGVDIPKGVWHNLESLAPAVSSSNARKARMWSMTFS